MNTQFFTFNFAPQQQPFSSAAGAGDPLASTAAAAEQTLPAGGGAADPRRSQFDAEFAALLTSPVVSVGAADANAVSAPAVRAQSEGGESNTAETPGKDALSPNLLTAVNFPDAKSEEAGKTVHPVRDSMTFSSETSNTKVSENAEPGETLFAAADAADRLVRVPALADAKQADSNNNSALPAAQPELINQSDLPPVASPTIPPTTNNNGLSLTKDARLLGAQNLFADLKIRLSAGSRSEESAAPENKVEITNDDGAQASGHSGAVSAPRVNNSPGGGGGGARFEDEKLVLQNIAAEIKAGDEEPLESSSSSAFPLRSISGIPVTTAPAAPTQPIQPQGESAETNGNNVSWLPLTADIKDAGRANIPASEILPEKARQFPASSATAEGAVIGSENFETAEKTSPSEQNDKLPPPPPFVADSNNGEMPHSQPELNFRDSRAAVDRDAERKPSSLVNNDGTVLPPIETRQNSSADAKIRVSGENEVESAGGGDLVAISPAGENDLPRGGWDFEGGKLFLQKAAEKIKSKIDASNSFIVFPFPKSVNQVAADHSLSARQQGGGGFAAVEKPLSDNDSIPTAATAARDANLNSGTKEPTAHEAINFPTAPTAAAAGSENVKKGEKTFSPNFTNESPASSPTPGEVAATTAAAGAPPNQNSAPVLQPAELIFQNRAATNNDPLSYVKTVSPVTAAHELFADLKIRLSAENESPLPAGKTAFGLTDAAEIAPPPGYASAFSPLAAHGSLSGSRFEGEKLVLQNIAARIKTGDETSDNPFASLLAEPDGQSASARTAPEIVDASGGGGSRAGNSRFAELLARQIDSPMLELARAAAAVNQPRQIRIRMRPEELGTIEIRIETRANGELHAQLKAENQTARQQLSENLGQLQKTLENAGWQVERLEVLAADHNDSGFFGSGNAAADQREKREQTDFFGSALNHDTSPAADENGIEDAAIRPDKIVSVRA